MDFDHLASKTDEISMLVYSSGTATLLAEMRRRLRHLPP
jgi:hypothetical protein